MNEGDLVVATFSGYKLYRGLEEDASGVVNVHIRLLYIFIKFDLFIVRLDV